MKIIDIECDIPTREVFEEELLSLEKGGAQGMANYIHIFGPKWAADAGMTNEEFEDAKKRMTPLEVRKLITQKSIENAMSEQAFVQMLDQAGVAYACIGTGKHAVPLSIGADSKQPFGPHSGPYKGGPYR